jgi:hypothetical protein
MRAAAALPRARVCRRPSLAACVRAPTARLFPPCSSPWGRVRICPPPKRLGILHEMIFLCAEVAPCRGCGCGCCCCGAPRPRGHPVMMIATGEGVTQVPFGISGWRSRRRRDLVCCASFGWGRQGRRNGERGCATQQAPPPPLVTCRNVAPTHQHGLRPCGFGCISGCDESIALALPSTHTMIGVRWNPGSWSSGPWPLVRPPNPQPRTRGSWPMAGLKAVACALRTGVDHRRRERGDERRRATM